MAADLIWSMIEGAFLTVLLIIFPSCVTDRSLLAEIIYDEKAFTAYAHTHVFRYADRFFYLNAFYSNLRFFRVQLFFTCTIQLCFREDGGCDGISPPRCLESAPPGFY